MRSYKQKEQLARLHKNRKEETDILVHQAINRLLADGLPITFVSVAVEAGVARRTLYLHHDLRKRIESLKANT